LKTLTFTLSIEDTNKIMASLGKQPYELVADLIHNLRVQAQPQLNPPAPAPVEEKSAE
jgi:hypothetical protein